MYRLKQFGKILLVAVVFWGIVYLGLTLGACCKKKEKDIPVTVPSSIVICTSVSQARGLYPESEIWAVLDRTALSGEATICMPLTSWK